MVTLDLKGLFKEVIYDVIDKFPLLGIFN